MIRVVRPELPESLLPRYFDRVLGLLHAGVENEIKRRQLSPPVLFQLAAPIPFSLVAHPVRKLIVLTTSHARVPVYLMIRLELLEPLFPGHTRRWREFPDDAPLSPHLSFPHASRLVLGSAASASSARPLRRARARAERRGDRRAFHPRADTIPPARERHRRRGPRTRPRRPPRPVASSETSRRLRGGRRSSRSTPRRRGCGREDEESAHGRMSSRGGGARPPRARRRRGVSEGLGWSTATTRRALVLS